MLKHSVQIELFPILWVTKLIYSESPMYTVLDKDTIKNKILPHLSKAKRGYVTQSCLIEVVNAILYKLKTGCQWSFLPVEALFSGKVLSYGAVYHHYNKWSKSGEWKSCGSGCLTNTAMSWICPAWIWTGATRLHSVAVKKSDTRDGRNGRRPTHST